MRLTVKEKTSIIQTILSYDQDAKIYLFGSRTNDALKGGDIGLLVESQTINYEQKIEIIAKIKNDIEDQKIDIMLSSDILNDDDEFIQKIRPTLSYLTDR